MTSYDLEVVTAPLDGENWSTHHKLLDIIPGTVLEAAPNAPTFLITVDADSPAKAVMLVEGVCTLLAISIESVNISAIADDLEPADYTAPEAHQSADWVAAAGAVN